MMDSSWDIHRIEVLEAIDRLSGAVDKQSEISKLIFDELMVVKAEQREMRSVLDYQSLVIEARARGFVLAPEGSDADSDDAELIDEDPGDE